MSSLINVFVPSRSRRFRAILAVLAVVALGVVGLAVGPSVATAAAVGVITNPTISTVYDGTVVSSFDSGPHNGVVANNDAVGLKWTFSTPGLTNGVFSETLPAGWHWNTSSLGSLTSSTAAYTSSYTLSADGLTLTATVNVPANGSQSLIELSTLTATPGSSVLNKSVFTPTLSATDSSGTASTSATPITTKSEQSLLFSNRLAGTNGFSTHDFGSGPVRAQYNYYVLFTTPPHDTTTLGYQDAMRAKPFTISDSYVLTAPAGTPIPTTVDVENVSPDMGVTISGTNPITVTADQDYEQAVFLKIWIPDSQLSVGTVTISNTATPVNWISTTGDPITASPATSSSIFSTTQSGHSSAFGNLAVPTSLPANYTDFEAWTIAYYEARDPLAPGIVFPRRINSILLPESAFAFANQFQRVPGSWADDSGSTNLMVYNFWNPAFAHIVSDKGYIVFSRSDSGLDAKIPTNDYTVMFTNGTDNSNPSAMTFYPSVAAAGGRSGCHWGKCPIHRWAFRGEHRR